MKYIYNDGGRQAAGFKGTCGDCVTRAVAIATEQPYEQVYQALAKINETYRGRKRHKSSMGVRTSRNGIPTKSVGFKRYMTGLGWCWTPTMRIGSGCTVHLEDGELPMGRLIVAVSKHYCAVIDGVIHDIYDPTEREEWIYPAAHFNGNIPAAARLLATGDYAYAPKRCVYGYWQESTPSHARWLREGVAQWEAQR